MNVPELIFTELAHGRNFFLEKPYATFHENPTSGLVADGRKDVFHHRRSSLTSQKKKRKGGGKKKKRKKLNSSMH
jgi:hypothetical protein